MQAAEIRGLPLVLVLLLVPLVLDPPQKMFSHRWAQMKHRWGERAVSSSSHLCFICVYPWPKKSDSVCLSRSRVHWHRLLREEHGDAVADRVKHCTIRAAEGCCQRLARDVYDADQLLRGRDGQRLLCHGAAQERHKSVGESRLGHPGFSIAEAVRPHPHHRLLSFVLKHAVQHFGNIHHMIAARQLTGHFAEEKRPRFGEVRHSLRVFE